MGRFEASRSRAIARVDRYLRRVSAPRLHMVLILCATGICGFICSFLLLHIGLKSMAWRYLMAVAFAYLVFFLMLRLWLFFQDRDRDAKTPGAADALDALDGVTSLAGDLDVNALPDDSGTDAADAASALDLDDLVLVVAAIAAVLGGLIACAYVIYAAPSLFAEVLVDGALMSALSRRLRGEAPAHWSYGAIRRTWLPALIAALLFSVAGFALQCVAPKADSIGDAVKHLL